MTGDADRTTESKTAAPVLFLLLLCVVGMFAAFLPWFDVEFAKSAIAEAENMVAESRQLPVANNIGAYITCQDAAAVADETLGGILWNPKEVYESRGVDLNMGFASAVFFGALALLWFLTPDRYRLSVPVTSVGMILSAVLFLSMLAARLEIQNIPFRLTADSGMMASPKKSSSPAAEWQICNYWQAEADSAAMVPDAPGQPPAPMRGFAAGPARTISHRAGYFLALGMASVLLVLTGSGLRSAVFDQLHSEPTGESRGDIVTVPTKDISAGLLPDSCVVCGKHTTDRVQKSIQYQSKIAQACMLAGFVLGGIPGVIIAIATVKDVPVPCPVCAKHRNHWGRLTLFASLGWLIPVLLGGTGFLLGFFATSHSLQPTWLAITGLVTGLVLGLATYLIPVIYMASTNVKCEQTSNEQITFSRVSSSFARAARGKKG